MSHSVSHVVARLAEYEGVSRRTAQRVATKAMDMVHKDLEAVNVENPQMATVLIHNLQECMARGMESNNIGAAVAAARELSAMLGIGVHNRRPPILPALKTQISLEHPSRYPTTRPVAAP